MSWLIAVVMLLAAAALWLGSVVAFRWLIRVTFDGAERIGLIRYSDRRPPEPQAAESAEVWARMKAMAEPALRLDVTDAAGFSKIGGHPELPDDMEWPWTGPRRSARTFVAQIDLGEVSASGGPEWLPKEGRLYVFKESDGFGRPDDTLVLFSSAPPGPEATPPEDLKRKDRFPERRVGFQVIKSIPSLDWLGLDVRLSPLSGDELDFLADAPTANFGVQPLHQIGGFPAEIQGEQMQISCEYLERGLRQDWSPPPPEEIVRASKDWRLLLQIDSDQALKMDWGDGGMLYVFIREKDARAGDFSKTVSLWQTH
jgi:uncharacterized protein YwqG